MFSTETGLIGFIDETGNIIINCQYDWAWDFDSYGYARVWDTEDNCLIIDINGIPVR